MNKLMPQIIAARKKCPGPKCFEIPGELFLRLHKALWNCRLSGAYGPLKEPKPNLGIPIRVDEVSYFCGREWAARQ